ncbi:MAG: carboxylating nicotinate-nucleotide diphosphorylase [Phycisphaerales bacterium]|nr:carboxylating nicotinate-nucleotide diphosphorylase [Phycisphaerales bacterium]
MSDASRHHDSTSTSAVDRGLCASIENAATTLMPPLVASELLIRTLAEDEIHLGDVTTRSMVGASEVLSAQMMTRKPGVIAGLGPLASGLRETPWAKELSMTPIVADGDRVAAGQAIASVTGSSQIALELERSLLNLLCLSCGVATLTAQFVAAVSHTKAVICGTRKTIPGLRAWQKYAVICGGGEPHRMSLADAAMFKDNHLAGVKNVDLAHRVAEASRRARALRPLKFVAVEVDTIDQFQSLLNVDDALVDIALMDNMPADLLARCVALRDKAKSRLLLEATGNVTLANVAALAESGVDRISTGSITHSASWLDIGLDITFESDSREAIS